MLRCPRGPAIGTGWEGAGAAISFRSGPKRGGSMTALDRWAESTLMPSVSGIRARTSPYT